MNKTYRMEELHGTLNEISTYVTLERLATNPSSVSLKDLGKIEMSCVVEVRYNYQH